MNSPKVFAIGFHKTGTTSLAKALRILGYRVCGGFGYYDPQIEENIYTQADSLLEKYDACQDQPWPILYKYLDRKYPGSKFILVIRDTDKWIKSVVRDFGEYDSCTREYIYGVGHPIGNEQIYIDRYEKHNAEVIEYFKDRPQDCLILYLDKGEVSWDTICPFLGKEKPDVSWPHVNKATNKKIRMLISRIQRKVNYFFTKGK